MPYASAYREKSVWYDEVRRSPRRPAASWPSLPTTNSVEECTRSGRKRSTVSAIARYAGDASRRSGYPGAAALGSVTTRSFPVKVGYRGAMTAHSHPRRSRPSTERSVTTLTPFTCGG